MMLVYVTSSFVLQPIDSFEALALTVTPSLWDSPIIFEAQLQHHFVADAMLVFFNLSTKFALDPVPRGMNLSKGPKNSSLTLCKLLRPRISAYPVLIKQYSSWQISCPLDSHAISDLQCIL